MIPFNQDIENASYKMEGVPKMKLGMLCYLRYNAKVLMLHRTKKKNGMYQNMWIGLVPLRWMRYLCAMAITIFSVDVRIL